MSEFTDSAFPKAPLVGAAALVVWRCSPSRWCGSPASA